jgi:hypothetical protein
VNVPLRVCPDTGEIARLAPQGANAELQAHLSGCASCAEDWRVQREMARLGAALPFTGPEPLQQRRVRAALLARLADGDAPPMPRPERRRPRPWVIAGAAVAVAAAGLLLVLRPERSSPQAPIVKTPAQPAPAPRAPARLRASTGARYVVESGPPHERVRLHQGRLVVEVTPARAGESFRIVTARGEVEVRGTVFETVATPAGLQAVRVERGKVAVRPDAGTQVMLLAGDSWQRAPEPAAARPARAERPPADPAPVDHPGVASAQGGASRHWRSADDVPRPATGNGPPIVWPELDRPAPASPPATAEAAFGSGLQLLRSGRNAAAADAFDRAAALVPAGPLAEDAWYWRAVALARQGGAGGATALAQFLDRYPFSARRGEAAVMLGWLLFDRGDSAGAQRQFRVGLGDRSARVRNSAQAGLARLAARGVSPR